MNAIAYICRPYLNQHLPHPFILNMNRKATFFNPPDLIFINPIRVGLYNQRLRLGWVPQDPDHLQYFCLAFNNLFTSNY